MKKGEGYRTKWARWKGSYDGLPGIFVLLADHLRGQGASDLVSLENWDFDPLAKVRSTDPRTAHWAAVQRLPVKNTQRWKILLAHSFHPSGMIDIEAYEWLERSGLYVLYDSLTTRMKDLMDGGWLEDTGCERMGHNGVLMMVRKITLKGLREFGSKDGIEIEFEE